MRYVPGSKPIVSDRAAGRPGPEPSTGRATRAHAEVARRPRRINSTTRAEPAPRNATRTMLLRWLKPITKLFARASLAVVVVGVFVFGVFPTSRYVEKRSELERARTELAGLEAENQELQEQVDRLDDDAEIERVARERYDMVFPDEDVYAVLPPAGG